MVHEYSQKSLFRKGFSLVELLAVMAVIAILLSLASVGVSRIGKSQGLTSGLSITEAFFSQARALAVGQGTFTRVVIHSKLDDQNELDRRRYRKMMMIMQREVDEDTGELGQEWVSAGQPIFLPDQVYYSPELSSDDVQDRGIIEEGIHRMGPNPEDQVNSYFYEFNPQGVCTTPGSSFILETGSRPPNSERPVSGPRRKFGGFMIARNGRTLLIRDTSKLDDTQ